MRLLAFRLLALLALALCASLLTDDLLSQPAFCGLQHGCDDVTFSPYGRPLGVPLPVVGLASFGLLFALTFFPPAGRLLGPLGLLAGFAGAGLFLVQWLVLRRFCPLCLVVDVTAMLLAIGELALPAPGPSAVVPAARRWAWAGAFGVAVVGPLLWGWLKPPPPVPGEVRALWQDGTVTVVEVTDFDCKYCRQNHPVLKAFLEEQGGRVRFVRLVHPLPQHANAWPAARAYRAAEVQGRAEAMADALFAGDDLSPQGCERLAAGLGLDLSAYRACVSDPATDEAIARSTAWVEANGLHGLPLIWVQDQLLVGVQTPEILRAALRRAERAHRTSAAPASGPSLLLAGVGREVPQGYPEADGPVPAGRQARAVGGDRDAVDLAACLQRRRLLLRPDVPELDQPVPVAGRQDGAVRAERQGLSPGRTTRGACGASFVSCPGREGRAHPGEERPGSGHGHAIP